MPKARKRKPAKKKTASKKVVTHAALSKKIDASLTGLNAALADSAKAVNGRVKEAKKLATDTARLRKNHMTLMQRKQAAANRLRKDKSAQNRNALNAVIKEIAGIAKLLNKANVAKESTASEVAGLKADQRRVVVYVKVLGQADKALNTPKKKPSRKKPATKVKLDVEVEPPPVVDTVQRGDMNSGGPQGQQKAVKH